MAENPQPVLFYNRIDENRQNTWFLIGAFVVLMLPLPTVVVLMLPLVPSFAPYLARYSPFVMWVLLTSGIAALRNALPVSSSLLLRHVGAHRVTREEQPSLWRTVENLCIGAGLPPPALYLVESEVANAFATGHDPDHHEAVNADATFVNRIVDAIVSARLVSGLGGGRQCVGVGSDTRRARRMTSCSGPMPGICERNNGPDAPDRVPSATPMMSVALCSVR